MLYYGLSACNHTASRSNMLSEKEILSFAESGHLVLPDFISDSAIQQVRNRMNELLQSFDPTAHRSIFTTDEQERNSDDHFLNSGDKIRFFFEEDAFDAGGNLRQEKELSVNKVGHALHDLDPVFDEFSRDARFGEIASELGFRNPGLIQSMYIFKQPHIGGAVDCHQDATFLITEPSSVMGFWIALEDADLENGCLWTLPGGHREGLKSLFKRTPHNTTEFETLDDTLWDDSRLVPLEVESGTLVLLHGLLPHRSLPNRSPRTRHAYTLHLIEQDLPYPEWNWLQRHSDLPLRGFR